MIAIAVSGMLPIEYVNVEFELVPQVFCAATPTVPPVVPTVMLILFVVDEPVQPLGNIHI